MKESMTLEQFIQEHSNTTIRIMSPGGYVTIPPNRQTDRLVAHAGVSGTEMPVHWEELREQMVESCNYNEAGAADACYTKSGNTLKPCRALFAPVCPFNIQSSTATPAGGIAPRVETL